MDIQLEKIALIKLLADVADEVTLRKVRAVLTHENGLDETDRLRANPMLVKKVAKARKEIKEGKGVKMDIKDLWK